MALDDNAVVLPGIHYYFWNDTPNAPLPFTTQAQLAALDLEADFLGAANLGWTNLGHTSIENNSAITKDGSEGDIKGTVQRRNLRKLPDQNTWGLQVKALQATNLGLDLYFGAGNVDDEDWYWVKSNAKTLEGSIIVVLVDGDARVPLVLPKVSSTADDAPEFDTENFMEFPLKMTALDHASAKGLMGFFKAGLGTPA